MSERERPIFISDVSEKGQVNGLVEEIPIKFDSVTGQNITRKQINIRSIHDAAKVRGYAPILEISTSSEDPLGKGLSAFVLTTDIHGIGQRPVECAYQGSKVYKGGKSFPEFYSTAPIHIKSRLREIDTGPLEGYRFNGMVFPMTPKSVFYDWLYINAILPRRQQLEAEFNKYAGFSDIAFGASSVACQARSCALFLSLIKLGLLDDAVKTHDAFIETMKRYT